MATSQRSRVRKPESVQFWLCVGAVSLALHSSLLFGLQRWAKMTVVMPDGGPIAVELVDAPDTVASKPEPDANTIAQVPQKPNAKPDAQPEVEPEAKPEIQPEPEPEVVRSPEPKRESIVPPQPSSTPQPSSVPHPKPKESQDLSPKVKPSPKAPVKPKPSPSDKPLTSDDSLTTPGNQGGRSLAVNVPTPKLISTPGEIGGRGTARLRLNYPQTVPFPATFSLKSGDVIRAKVKFLVTGNDIQSPEIKELSPKLSGRDRDALLQFVYDFLMQVSVGEISIDTDAVLKPDTDWETTIELRL